MTTAPLVVSGPDFFRTGLRWSGADSRPAVFHEISNLVEESLCLSGSCRMSFPGLSLAAPRGHVMAILCKRTLQAV